MNIGQLPFPVIQRIAADFRGRYAFDPRRKGALTNATAQVDRLLVKYIRNLTRRGIEAWLNRSQIKVHLPMPDQALYGFLYVQNEMVIIFLEADADPKERKFTLAHELAHYLLEYVWPQQQAIRVLGQGAASLFSKRRLPDLKERVWGTLHDLPLYPRKDLLSNKQMDAAGRLALAAAENNADMLAFELMAPFELLRSCEQQGNHRATFMYIHNLLQTVFDFPPTQAQIYAQLTTDRLLGRASVQELLGLS